MMKKTVISIYYALVVILVTSLLGACVPKKVSPTDDEVLHQTTRAALENSAAPAGDSDGDDDDDGAWEADSGDQISRSKHLAKLYSRSHDAATGSTGDLLQKARTALGTPYVRGGTSRNGGFDCSGFVQWSYNHVGIQLPRTAREQSQVGKAIRRVDDMQAGDIVAFRHPRRGYHTGIYVGDGKFIHSPRKRNVVRINSLDDPYFNQTFLGARRLNVSNEGDIEAAEKMLAAYANQPPSRKVVSSSRSKKKSSSSVKSNSKKRSSDKASAGKAAKTTKAKDVAVKADKTDKKNKKAPSTASKDRKSSTKAKAASASKDEKKKSSSGRKGADTKKKS